MGGGGGGKTHLFTLVRISLKKLLVQDPLEPYCFEKQFCLTPYHSVPTFNDLEKETFRKHCIANFRGHGKIDIGQFYLDFFI